MLLRLTALFTVCTLLTGCAAPLLVAGGAAAGVVIAKDRRSTDVMLSDERIELSSQGRITDDPQLLKNSHINITSYNGVVLITGEIPLPVHKVRVEKLVRSERGVREVRNELRIAPPSDTASRRNDTAITTRVISRLFKTENIDSTNVKVVSENATVYLMGLLNREEAEKVVQVVRRTPGVMRVVKVFEYDK